MELIEKELDGRTWPEPEALVIKRCIHTSADFDYADQLYFSPGAVSRALKLLKDGAHIITDTKMAAAGINKKRLAALGGQVHCFMDDPEVAREAKERGITRSAVCNTRSRVIPGTPIFAIGNAPTALIRLYELLREGKVHRG